jgi:hypothetical protein
MVTRRKQRSDSIAGELTAHLEARLPDPLYWPQDVALPVDVEDARKAKVIFSELQHGRNHSYWRPHHARMLAEYALLTGQIDKLMALVLKTGAVTQGKNGHLTRSPLLDAMSMMVSQRAQLLKSLGLIGARAEEDSAAKSANSARLVHKNSFDSLLAGGSDLI